MKNKFTWIIALIANLHFVNTAHCNTFQHDNNEYYTEKNSFDCNIRKGYRYVTLGVGPVVFIPNLSIGYRERYSQFGWDTALGFSTIGYVHQLSAHFVGHYYLSPSHQDSTYLGLGLIGGGIFFNEKKSENTTLSPNFVVGKELKKREGDNRTHFIEMHVAALTMLMRKKRNEIVKIPFIYVKYGISF